LHPSKESISLKPSSISNMGVNEEDDALTEEGVYAALQGLLRKGLVLIVGSGASSAYGLPGMAQLAKHVLEKLPEEHGDFPRKDLADEWDAIADRLREGDGLERALEAGLTSKRLGEQIAQLVGNYIAESEREALSQILHAEQPSQFGLFFAHMLRITDQFDVVTTNYDRLIEVHAARALVTIDTMFFGHTVGRLDAQRSQDELWQIHTPAGDKRRKPQARRRPHVSLSKPHGSLNWYLSGEILYRSDIFVEGNRRIIAPGGDKFRLGYDRPFDVQRERANRAIEAASGILFVGYGFNDSHLETYFSKEPGRTPSAVISKGLTSNAREYLRQDSSTIGIEEDTQTGGCIIWCGNQQLKIDKPLWDFDVLTKEVFAI
jgi:hypothetical protein